jgi:sarcosine oxidase delta subunit
LEVKEKELLKEVIKQFGTNIHYIMNHKDYNLIESKLRDEWFTTLTMTRTTCPRCGDLCQLEFTENDDFVICPNTHEIIDITDEQRFKYKFKLDEFLCVLQEEWKIEKRGVSWENFSSIGSTSHKEDKWLIMFGLGNERTNSIGNIMELRTHFPQDYILLVVNEPLKYEESQKQILNNMGVFLATWEDSLELTFNHIYSEKEQVLLLTRDVLNAGANKDTEIVMSALKHAATTAQGTEFERQVYNVIRQLFQIAMPFGSKYTGFGIPDGVISEGKNNPFPIMFYDCKSFKGTDYRHKSEIPMQVNYYEDFLEKFFAKEHAYRNTGFIIFANDYSTNAQGSIMGSPHWQYVREKCTVFFMNVKALEKADEMAKKFFVQSGFNSFDFFQVCFENKTNLFNDKETEQYYQQLFNDSLYSNLRFIDETRMELALITGIANAITDLNSKEGLSKDLKAVIKNSMHEKKKMRVYKPVISIFLSDFIEMMKSDELIKEFHPISILLVMNRFDDDLRSAVGEDKYEETLDDVQSRIEELLKKV